MKITLAPLLLLSACTVGPNFTAPKPPAASNFNHGAPGVTQTDPNPDWWNGFHDPTLSSLMKTAIAGSPSLQQALLRVAQAHQNTATTAAQGLPTLSASGSYTRQLAGLKGLAESSSAYGQLNKLAGEANSADPGSGGLLQGGANGFLDNLNQPINFYQYGLSSSWELDLFGRVRRAVEASKASEAQAQDAARDALVMLESQVAQAYFQVRATQAARAQQQQIVQAAQMELQLTQSRARSGLTSDTDVDQARTEFLTEQGQLPSYDKQIAQSLDQLDVLAGQPPGTLDATLSVDAPLPAPPELIGAGVPATLARRRPDIREAEDSLHQATAEIGVAKASFYPDISLTGSLGFRSLDASNLTNWANLFYSAGPSISLPIFEGGRLTAQLRLARIEQASAALQYRATVLRALAEVEDNLVAYRADQQSQSDAQATAQAANDTLHLTKSRYDRRLISFLPVLDAERNAFQAQQKLLQAQAQLDDDAAALYTSLGGGWQEKSQAATMPQIDGMPPIAPAAADSLAAGTISP